MEKNPLVALLILLLSYPMCTEAQSKKKTFVKKDLFTVSSGLTGGIMAAHSIQDIYINGSVEYYMESRVSVKTDVYWFLPDYNFEGQLQKNTSVFMGGAWHFPYLRWDTYIAFQPGLAFPALTLGLSSNTTKTGIEPVIAAGAGVNYFIRQNLHVFASASYVHGTYYYETSSPFLLDEVRFSLGFGFNVFFNRYAPYERRRPRF